MLPDILAAILANEGPPHQAFTTLPAEGQFHKIRPRLLANSARSLAEFDRRLTLPTAKGETLSHNCNIINPKNGTTQDEL
jgi:hypothetical protein